MTGLKLYAGDPVTATIQAQDGERYAVPDVIDVMIADGALVLHDSDRLTTVLAPVAWAVVEWRRP